MANIQGAKKRARQNQKRRLHNTALRSKYRTYIKKVMYAVEEGDKEEAEAAYREAVPIIDNMVNKGIIHRNKAARHKSRLNHHLRSM